MYVRIVRTFVRSLVRLFVCVCVRACVRVLFSVYDMWGKGKKEVFVYNQPIYHYTRLPAGAVMQIGE